jgi:hypothetical protein
MFGCVIIVSVNYNVTVGNTTDVGGTEVNAEEGDTRQPKERDGRVQDRGNHFSNFSCIKTLMFSISYTDTCESKLPAPKFRC